jgi:hypothetical protein
MYVEIHTLHDPETEYRNALESKFIISKKKKHQHNKIDYLDLK